MGFDEIGQIGRGWHELEHAETPFRWTMREAEFYLKNSGAHRLSINVRCNHPDAADSPVALSLEVNGTKVGEAHLADHAWHDLTFELEDNAADSLLNCKLRVSRTWMPKRYIDSTDGRELGVAVSRAWLE